MDDPRDGRPWDVSDPQKVKRLFKLIEHWGLYVVVGSPPCTALSRLQVQWTYQNMDPQRVKPMVDGGRHHLHRMVSLYHIQLDAGRHVLHGHRASALAWLDPWVETLIQDLRAHAVTSGQCEYGLVTRGVPWWPCPREGAHSLGNHFNPDA